MHPVHPEYHDLLKVGLRPTKRLSHTGKILYEETVNERFRIVAFEGEGVIYPRPGAQLTEQERVMLHGRRNPTVHAALVRIYHAIVER